MDNAKTRRGKPCWHTLPEVGLEALNDGVAVNELCTRLVLRDLDVDTALQVVEALTTARLITAFGQRLDMQGSQVPLSSCTSELYEAIAYNKTSHYSVYFPVLLAVLLDDYLDLYGKSEFGKQRGGDILERKCTWLLSSYVSDVGQNELKHMEEAFKSDDRITAVQKLFDDQGLPSRYQTFCKDEAERISCAISSFEITELRDVLMDVLMLLENRSR